MLEEPNCPIQDYWLYDMNDTALVDPDPLFIRLGMDTRDEKDPLNMESDIVVVINET